MCELHDGCPRLTTTRKTTILGPSSLDLVTSFGLGARIQSNLADERAGSSWTKVPVCDGLSVCGVARALRVA